MTSAFGSASRGTSFLGERATFLVDLRVAIRLTTGEGWDMDGGRRLLTRFLGGAAAHASSSLSGEERLRGFLPLLEEEYGAEGPVSERRPFSDWLGSALECHLRVRHSNQIGY